ncbi:MAG: 50S ribosomal protein L10 [Oscillospiraceae bacterium]|jgi:large subunit ribosomal protein L10|nr:50S ribosomal protein L10 [Oscillospiraceae bacterium]
MPNARVLSEKKKIVGDLTEKLKSQAGVLVNYTGIKVNEDTEMRVKLREANIDYSVIKNTLMRFAIKNVGFDELESVLVGTTSLAVSKDDPVAPARIIKEYADKYDRYFEIKGGFMDGKILSVDEVNALASIPPLPILQAQLLGTMLAPIASLAIVLKAIAEKDGASEDATAETQEETAAEAAIEPTVPSETPEAAPEVATEAASEEAAAEIPADEAATADAPAE